MHIGFLSPEYVIPPDRIDGGLANYLRKIAHELTKRGQEVSIIVLSNRNATWKDGSITIYELKKVSIPRWISPCKSLKPIIPVINQYFSTKQVAKKVWEIHRKHPFQILQTSDYMAPGYSLIKNGKIPVVCRISSYTPIWRLATGERCTLGDHLMDWMEIQQVVKSDGSFAPSNLLAGIFSYCQGYTPDIIRTPIEIPNNMVFNALYYQEHLLNRKYLLYFGTLCEIKGVDIIIKVLPEILQRHTDLSIAFIGRDDGFSSGKKCVEEIFANCENFQDRIVYHPPLSKSALYPVIAHAQGVLMPSRLDNYPNVCLEAQSLGVPVIGTYGSSLDEMIIDGKTGFLAENASAESLSDVVEQLLNLSEDQKQEMRQNILKHLQNMLLEDRVGQLVTWYQSVVKEYHNSDLK